MRERIISLLFMATLVSVAGQASTSINSQHGAWAGIAFAAVWLIGFFIAGLTAHGIFYWAVLPLLPKRLTDREKVGPFVTMVEAFWFLQAPFAGFNTVGMAWKASGSRKRRYWRWRPLCGLWVSPDDKKTG